MKSIKRSICFVISGFIFFIFFHFFGIAFTGGDDPFIAMDYLSKGGLWNAAVSQGIGQGRVFAIFTYYLAELSFKLGFEWTNLFKIISSSLTLLLYFLFIKKTFSLNFSILNMIVFLLIFDWYGGDFNPIHNVTQWYSIGFNFLLGSFIVFIDELKNNKKFVLSAILYFCALIFYEIILGYIIIFPMLYFYKGPKVFKVKNLFLKSYYFILAVVCYLSIYFLFRVYFPSQYIGNQQFFFGDLFNSFFTIIRMSLLGIGFKYWGHFSLLNIGKALFSSTLCIFLLIVFFRKNEFQSFIKNYKSIKVTPNLLFIPLIIALPNVMFGFIEKYHNWYGYYVGSFFSAFAIVPLITYLLLLIKNNFTKGFYISVFLLFISANGIYLNYFTKFDEFKVDREKWALMDEIILQSKSVLKNNDLICSDNLFKRKSSYNVYPYWDNYIFSKIKIKPSVVFQVEKEKIKERKWPGVISNGCECNWNLNFQSLPNSKYSLSLNNDSYIFNSISGNE
tara:strand:- start:390 stop:1904 length:1515 start_codon:yes stop_codon:yes gene_type:complete